MFKRLLRWLRRLWNRILGRHDYSTLFEAAERIAEDRKAFREAVWEER